MSDTQELLTRGVANIIPNQKSLLGKLQNNKKLNIYLGIDPTSTKIHLGHAVVLRKLNEFAKNGHNVTFLIGDFTALIGDTSDKDSERPALSSKEVEENFKTYKKQAEKIVDFSKVKVKYNSQWLKKLTFEEIIKLCGHFSVGDFVGRELIRKRLGENKRVGLHELLYPVMQGYDSFMLNTDVQIGGTDQTFNMQAGRTLIKDLKNKDSFVLTTTILKGTDGRKMSKSLGNSPDLLLLIHEYGADAVRFGIMISAPAGNDLLFDENSLEQGKHFNNKLWNALKLMKMWEEKLSAGDEQAGTGNEFALSWFDSRLNEVRHEVETLMGQFRLSEALKTIYSLVWDDFCSWFLEWIKPTYGQAMSSKVYEKARLFFDELLQLLHPFMPFITEEIYHLLKERKDDLMVKQFSPVQPPDSHLLLLGNKLKEVITNTRDAKNKHRIKPKDAITLFIETDNVSPYDPIKDILLKQVNAQNIYFTGKPEEASVMMVVGNEKIYIESDTVIDTGSQKEKLLKDLEYLKGFLITVERKLSNDKFVKNAKPQVIELERKKKKDTEIKMEIIRQSLSSLE